MSGRRVTSGDRKERIELDPHSARRYELERLRALGVKLVEIEAPRSRALFERFAREFVEPAHRDDFLEAVKEEGLVDLDRFLRDDCTRRTTARGCLAWLGPTAHGARCVRFEKRADLPALEVAMETIDEIWAASWPGVFVNFDAGRALVITIDYEVLRCDLGALRRSPYR